MESTCVGSVRGACGVVHADESAAEMHIRRDDEGCASQGGYSDRRVVTGQDYTYAERCAIGDADMERLTAV